MRELGKTDLVPSVPFKKLLNMIDIRKLQNDWEFVVAFYSLVFVMKQRF
jgi:hypothetical protein